MKKIKRFLVMLVMFCGMFVSSIIVLTQKVNAADIMPETQYNLQLDLIKTSYLVATEDGYMRVFYKDDAIGIEYYDDAFQILGRKQIAQELPLWGGFYAGSDGYYLVEGQKNEEENDSAEVIRIIRYDFNWNRQLAASVTSNKKLFGGQVRYPFEVGCIEMTESNGKLYVVTGHEGYVDKYLGQGHQGFLMIEVDKKTMQGNIVAADLSHSFAQYIRSKDDNLYVLEQSEGSRRTQLTQYTANSFKKVTIPILTYGGSRTSAWAIACYASVDDMELSDDNILCIETSIDQLQYDQVAKDTPHNIYLSVTPFADFTQEATVTKQLTHFTDNGTAFMGVMLTKINSDRFLVTWEENSADTEGEELDNLSSRTLHYIFVNGNGETISKEYTYAAAISDCKPIVKDSKVVYYASDSSTVNFYSIDTLTGNISKKSYRVAGDAATWNYADGVLRISGQGVVSFPKQEDVRYPISSTRGSYVRYSNSPWKSIRDKIENIVIESGITSVSENSFAFLPALKTVTVEDGLNSIGNQAFAHCSKLETISIPASVTEIDDDIVWTGSYWIGDYSHVNYAIIYAPYDSYAIEYAKKNNIRYASDLSGAQVSGIGEKYSYIGSAVTPEPVVKLGETELVLDSDYTLSYSDNDRAGTAKIEIVGKNHYFGNINIDFTIVSDGQYTDQTNQDNRKDSAQEKDKEQTNTVPTQPGMGQENKEIPLHNNTYYVKKRENNKQGNLVDVIVNGDYVYKLNKEDTTAVLIEGQDYNITSATIPEFIMVDGIQYSITEIGSKAFSKCQKLKQITIAGRVNYIGVNAFKGCSSLRKVIIGPNVKSIGKKAFYNCSKLVLVQIQSDKLTAKTVGKDAFKKAGCKNYRKLKVEVHKKKYNLYKKILKKKGLSSKAKIRKFM